MKKLTTEEFIKKANIIHKNKYNYSLSNYIHSNNKIKIICQKHGIFEQEARHHIGGRGCKKCALDSLRHTTEEFIKNAKLIHKDKYDYSKSVYINNKKSIKIKCLIHGTFNQIPNSHLAGYGCKKCGIISRTQFKSSNTNEFILKSKLIHKNKFDYSLVKYKNNQTKVKIICPEHGIFKQIPSSHLNGIGCSKCSYIIIGDKNRSNKDVFILNSKLIHSDKYDYSSIIYKNSNTKVKIFCKKHGVFNQTPHSHLSGSGCPTCKESKGEKKIREYLINNNIQFVRQKKFKDCRNILPLPFDFYLPEYNVCIEFNGKQHYEPWNSKKTKIALKEFENVKLRDKIKTDYCKNNKIILLKIKYNEDIQDKLNNSLKY